MYLYAMVAPPTGTHDVVITASSTIPGVFVEAANYINVTQSIPSNHVSTTVNNQSSYAVGPLSTGINSWVVGAVGATAVSGASQGIGISVAAPNFVRIDPNHNHVNFLVDSNDFTRGSDSFNVSGLFAPHSAGMGIMAELPLAQ